MATPDIPEALLESYIRSEFRAMDSDHDGKINRQQTLDLLTMLGCADGKKRLLSGLATVGIVMSGTRAGLLLTVVGAPVSMGLGIAGVCVVLLHLQELHVKSEDDIELEEYVKVFKADKTRSLVRETSRMRGWFKVFDKNGDGTATKEEIISGLESVDILVDKELHLTVEKMDANHDGKITYEEFLVTQFRISLMDKAKK